VFTKLRRKCVGARQLSPVPCQPDVLKRRYDRTGSQAVVGRGSTEVPFTDRSGRRRQKLVACDVDDASPGGGLSLAGTITAGSVSFAGSCNDASGVEEATSGVEVGLTDIGGSTSRILDAGEITDVGVLSLLAWLRRAPS
jgi:hypothetical protein